MVSFSKCPNRYQLQEKQVEDSQGIKKQEQEDGKQYETLTEYFYDLLPYAIEYGMSVDEFWKKDPDLFWAYRFSYVTKMKNELKISQQLDNQKAWIQGIYNCRAVSVAISNCFSKKSQIKYFEQPVDLCEDKETSEEKKLQQLKNNEAIMKARAIKTQIMLEKKSEKNVAPL